jgi:ATP-dependent DNA ligase
MPQKVARYGLVADGILRDCSGTISQVYPDRVYGSRWSRRYEFPVQSGAIRAGPHGIDAIIVGYQGDGGLTYVARIRNGFVPASRRQVFEKLRPLARVECPFVNLPETRQTRWGEALTAEKMKKCIWVNPELVAQIEFLEWTESDHLRHAKFAGLRDDKNPRSVIKEELARET